MKKYLTYFRISQITAFAFKADFFLYMAINMAFFYISIALWVTVYRSGGISQISDYTLSNTITYYLLTTFLYRLDLSGSLYLNEDVWSGYFNNDLIKPWNVIFVHIVYALSEISIGLISYLPFLLFMILTSFRLLTWPSLINLGLFFITVILALIMNIFFNLIFHALCFHFGDQAPQIEAANYAASFLAGGVVPLAFIPGVAQKIFLLLPFKYTFFVPAEIYLDKMETPAVLMSWVQIAIWTGVFYLIFRAIYQRGLKKYSGTGL